VAIKLEMLKTFCAVARSGNLAEAAQSMGRSQSALSMTLKQLEEELGSALFQTDRKSRLSEFGERVFDLAKQEVAHFDATISSLSTLAQNPAGTVRGAAIPSVSGGYFPQVLHRMQQHFPHTQVDLRDSDSRQVLDWLLRGQIDFGISALEADIDGVERYHVTHDDLGLICRVDHTLAQQAQVTISDVLHAQYVHNPVAQGHIDLAPAQVPLFVHNSFTLLSMVAAGPWVSILPRTILEAAYADVMFRDVAGLAATRTVYFYARRHSTNHDYIMQAYQELCDHIQHSR
jgi:DNA-binding transcriptional LysR family regulator